MKRNFAYIKPALSSTESRLNKAAYDESFELYEAKQYVQSVHRVLDHFNPMLRVKYAQPDGCSYHIPHGSILVQISICEGELVVFAPFLLLPSGAGRIPMLRRLAELNLTDLELCHFVLQGDEISLRYRCPLEQCFPHKIGYMLRELCMTGDKHDDEFVDQFGAVRLYDAVVERYDESEEQRILAAIRSCCQDTTEAIEEKVRARKFFDAWLILSLGLYRINYIVRPQGLLDSLLEEAIRRCGRSDVPNPELVADGVAFLNLLSEKSDDELKESIYKIEQIGSSRRASDIENIRSNIEDQYEEAVQTYSSGNFESCTLRCLDIYYRIFYFNDMQEDLNRQLSAALKASSELPFDQAASILLQGLKKVMDNKEDEHDRFCSEMDMIHDLPNIQSIQESLLQELGNSYADTYMQHVKQMMEAMKRFR